MIVFYQVIWAIWGLFLGLLIITPWLPTTNYSTQLVYTVAIVGSLIGILGFFQVACFVTACATALGITNMIKRVMAVLNAPLPKPKQIEHKTVERKI